MSAAWLRSAVVATLIGVIALPLLSFFILTSTIRLQTGNAWMEPDINMGDTVFGFRTTHPQPQFGDLVIYVPPQPQATLFVARIAGVPGDRVIIADGRLYRNDTEVSYNGRLPSYQLQVAGAGILIGSVYLDGNRPAAADWTAPDQIPADCYLVLANDERADDSHLFGFVPGSQNGPCASRKYPDARIVARVIDRWPTGAPIGHSKRERS